MGAVFAVILGRRPSHHRYRLGVRDLADDRRFVEVILDGGDSLAWVRGPVESSTTAVLLLHDRAMNGRAWDVVMRRLPAGVVAVAPDLRGRGSAWRLPGSTGVEQHAVDLERIIDQLDIDHVLAVGHRFGASVAQHLRRRVPDRVVMTVGIVGSGADPFHDVLGMAFRDRLEHRRHWEQHPSIRAVAGSDTVDGFVGHGIAGPEDHHRWRVDLRSLIADDASLAPGASDALTPAATEPFTRLIVAGSTVPGSAAVGWAAATTSAELGSVTHLPDADPVTVVLTAAGADAIVAQIAPLLAPSSDRR